jgi:uncharacterized protein (TIGR02996 family)
MKYNKYLEKALKYSASHDQFRLAKLANPKDDLPHLVHADYLEENDMPATAHFIRRVIERKHPDDKISSDMYRFAPVKSKNGFTKQRVRQFRDNHSTTIFLTHSSNGTDAPDIDYHLTGKHDEMDQIYKNLEDEDIPTYSSY